MQRESFLRSILRLSKHGNELQAASDQVGAPTSAKSIARATERLVRMYANSRKMQFPTGIYHLTASGATSWHGFVSAILRAAFQQKAPIVAPILTAEHSSIARRPKNSLLSCQKFSTTFGFQLSSWQQQLEEALAEIPAEILVDSGPWTAAQRKGHKAPTTFSR